MEWGNLWEVQGEATQELRNLTVASIAETTLGGSVLDQLVQTRFSWQLLDEALELLHTGVQNWGCVFCRLPIDVTVNPVQCEINNLHSFLRHVDKGANWGVAEKMEEKERVIYSLSTKKNLIIIHGPEFLFKVVKQ